jgi:hypothetical protein
MKIHFLFLFLAFILISCEKEIDLELNTTNPRFVIEGGVSTNFVPNLFSAQKVRSLVRISKSVDYKDLSFFPYVDNAIVIIKDETANQEYILTHKSFGIYTNESIIGEVGHTYSLYVKIEEEEFAATSTIQPLVPLDSLRQEGVAEEDQFGNANRIFAKIIPVYKDPPQKGNYYQFVVFNNGYRYYDETKKEYIYTGRVFDGTIYTESDRVFNNTVNTSDLKILAEKNDSIIIEMQPIEKNLYDYFYTLYQSFPQNGLPPSSNPTNPISNISNGALGYFKAVTGSRKSIKVK